MKKYFSFAAFMAALTMSAKEAKLTFQYQKSIELVIPADERIAINFYDRHYYYNVTKAFLNKIDKTGNSLSHTFYKQNIDNAEVDSFQLKFPYNDSLLQWGFVEISVNQHYIGIKSDKFYIFDRQTTDLVYTIPAFSCSDFLFLDKKRVLLTKNYNSHPNDDSIRTKLIIYNFLTDKIENSVYPDFNYLIYTHFVNNFIDAVPARLVFAQAIPYDISIYSAENLKVENVIKRDWLYNDKQTISTLDSLHSLMKTDFNAKKFFYALKQADTGINRIEKVIFLHEDTLLVSRYFPNSKFDKRYVDVWVYDRHEKEWNNIIYNQLYCTNAMLSIVSDNEITPDNFPLNLTYSSPLISDNGCLMLLSTKIAPTMGIKYSQRKMFDDKYYENHELNYFVWIYKWDIQ